MWVWRLASGTPAAFSCFASAATNWGRAGDAPRLLDQPPGRIGAKGDARRGPIEPVPDRRRFKLHCPVPSLRASFSWGARKTDASGLTRAKGGPVPSK